MEKLPEDLLSNILIQLPAKLLAQMRCVSKYLNAFLTQPSFVKSHLNRSIYDKDEVLLVFNNGHRFGSEPFTAHRSQSPQYELTNFIKFPFDSLSRSDFGKVIGSVNGLVCLYFGYNPVVHIWNPSLSAVITLPPYTIPSHGDTGIGIDFRFGYDPKTDDYKVVKLASRSSSCSTLFHKEWMKVEIYRMRKGSWKLITERVPSHVRSFIEKDDVCQDGHDGHLHWLVCIDGLLDVENILSFDLGDETFSEIPLPNYTCKGSERRQNVIAVLDGKLCVMSRYSSNFDWEVWVMNEYGVADSWVIHHVFTPLSPFSPYGFTLNNQFLFESYNEHLALSKSCKAEAKTFKSMAPFGSRYRTKVVVYVDSLVWVAPSKNVSALVGK